VEVFCGAAYFTSLICPKYKLTFVQPHCTECIDLHRTGFLKDSEISEWLYQRGTCAAPEPLSPDSVLEGSIRLLICECLFYHPLSFSMSKDSYLSVEREFGLHPATLPSFRIDSGIFSYHKTYNPEDQDIVSKISNSVTDSVCHLRG
jgi:hypothetical protein